MTTVTVDKCYSCNDGEASPTALPIHFGTWTRDSAEPGAEPRDIVNFFGFSESRFQAELGEIDGRRCWIVRRAPGERA